jgi:hypothetical protein
VLLLSRKSSFDRPRCRCEALLPLSNALAIVSRDPSQAVGPESGRLPQSGRIATAHSVNTVSTTAQERRRQHHHDSLNVTNIMATLAAHDQENAIRNISVGPGGKPLNAAAKGAKTPGNKAPKTPFKIPLNDENVIKQTGKTNGKGNENAFLTPAGMI